MSIRVEEKKVVIIAITEQFAQKLNGVLETHKDFWANGNEDLRGFSDELDESGLYGRYSPVAVVDDEEDDE